MPSSSSSEPLAAIARDLARSSPSASSPSSSGDAPRASASSSDDESQSSVERTVAALLDARRRVATPKPRRRADPTRPRPPRPDWSCARCGTRVNVVRWHSADAKWYFHHSRTRMCRRCNREHVARVDRAHGAQSSADADADADARSSDDARGRRSRRRARATCGQCGAEADVATFDAARGSWTWTRPTTRMCGGCDEVYGAAARAYESMFASEGRRERGALAAATPTLVYDVADD